VPTTTDTTPGARRATREAAAVGGAAVAAFALALGNGFVWDDVAFIPGNALFAAVADPRPFFRTGLWEWATLGGGPSPLYRPMSVALMWALDRVLGSHPAPWHAVGVLLHALDSVLVFLLARRLARGAGRAAALAGGFLFALHPVHVEAVAWTTSAFVHPFAAAFVLLAAHAQLAHARSGRGAWLLATAALSTAALLANEGAVAVPLLLAGLASLETRRRPTAPVLVAAAAPIALALALRANAVGPGIPVTVTPASLLSAVAFTLGYARNLVLPWPQPVYLNVPIGAVATPANVALGAATLAGAAWLAWRLPRGDRARPAFALAWIAATVAPLALAAMNPRPQFAPRGLYLATIGLALLAAWAVERLGAPPRGAVAAAGAVLAVSLLACVVATHGWRDELAVRLRMLDASPLASATHLRVGNLLDERGEGDRARLHLEAALRLAASPDERADALEGLGTHHGAAGRADLAEPLLRQLVAESPARSSGWLALGNVAFMRGELAAARAHYLEAFRLDAANYEAAYDLALVSQALGDAAAAESWARRAASLRPAAGARR
jgi:tetratricopeptide (TPR) repeat protein